MNVLGQFLDDRDERGQTAADSDKAAQLWQLRGERPEVRLLAFDRWLRIELERRLDWQWAGDHKEKRVEQCRVVLEQLVLDLWRRGWMLDGKALAARIVGLLDAVGTYQRKGGVLDFWSYFKSSVSRYVGANAEEIQFEARRLGSHVGQWAAVVSAATQKSASLPELAAQRAAEVAAAKDETLRERQARVRAKERASKADAQQPQLF